MAARTYVCALSMLGQRHHTVLPTAHSFAHRAPSSGFLFVTQLAAQSQNRHAIAQPLHNLHQLHSKPNAILGVLPAHKQAATWGLWITSGIVCAISWCFPA